MSPPVGGLPPVKATVPAPRNARGRSTAATGRDLSSSERPNMRMRVLRECFISGLLSLNKGARRLHPSLNLLRSMGESPCNGKCMLLLHLSEHGQSKLVDPLRADSQAIDQRSREPALGSEEILHRIDTFIGKVSCKAPMSMERSQRTCTTDNGKMRRFDFIAIYLRL